MSTLLANLRPVAITANGIFAGFGLAISFVAIPALRASGHSPRVWKELYGRGSVIAVSSILISSAAHFATYYLTHDKRALWCGALSFISVPYTFTFLRPINNRIGYMADHDSKEDATGVIEQWSKLHHFRALAGTTAFLLAVF